jgi:hypothetical protein
MCKSAVNRAMLAHYLYVGAKNGITQKSMIYYLQLVQVTVLYTKWRTTVYQLELYFLFLKKYMWS